MKYITDNKIKKETQDLRDLRWSRYRHSSGTAGSLLKAYSEAGNIKKYYKLSNYDAFEGIIGHECLNEIIADRILNVLEIDHLAYELVRAKIIVDDKELETWVCESDDFKKTGEQKIALDAFYQAERLPSESPLEFCKRNGWKDYFREMLLIDYLILNRDRHGANIEVLKDRKTQSVRLAPLFDHGLSFMCTVRLTDKNAINKFNVLEDRPVQSFIGGNSAERNLGLLPPLRIKKRFSDLKDSKEYVMHDLDDIAPATWQNKVWEMVLARVDRYESICNKRQ